jgi:superfamily II DNA or RNA helicase
MKALNNWSLSLRRWQIEAAKQVKEKFDKNEKDFLCVATPGAGKTIFALRIAHYLLSRNKIERIVIVCPTEHLKKQWAEAASKAGLEINPEFTNAQKRETSDYFGVAVTYAQIGREPSVHQKNSIAKKTLIIFDEIHHLGDDLTWGDAVKIAFSKSEFRLAISGTPFRRDNNPIPFVRYIKSQSKADYIYGYGDALHDNVCRPVFFPAFEGVMEWRKKDKNFRSTFSEALDRSQDSERLRTALDANGQWLQTVVEDADKKLSEIRYKAQPDAGGLIITIDQKHARQVAKLVEKISGELPPVVISDDPKASKKIKKFNDSSERWLVAVKMVSEGVDIPRLRVGVYATNIKSELFFRQAVGRFVRQQPESEKQDAFFYIPKDFALVDFAKQIEVERDHYINKNDYVRDIFDRDPFLDNPIKQIEEEDTFEAIHSEATDKFQFEMDFGKEFAPPMQAVKRKKYKGEPEKVFIPLWKRNDIPIFEQIEYLKKDIKDTARLVARKMNSNGNRIDWNLPHKVWIRMGGKPIEKESRQELIRRLEWLNDQL